MNTSRQRFKIPLVFNGNEQGILKFYVKMNLWIAWETIDNWRIVALTWLFIRKWVHATLTLRLMSKHYITNRFIYIITKWNHNSNLNLIVFQNGNLQLNVPVFAVKVESLGVLKPASLLQFFTISRLYLLQKVQKRKTRDIFWYSLILAILIKMVTYNFVKCKKLPN